MNCEVARVICRKTDFNYGFGGGANKKKKMHAGLLT